MRRIALVDGSQPHARSRVSSLLKDYGFIPIRGRVMMADLNSALVSEVMTRLRRMKLTAPGNSVNVLILDLCRKCESSLRSTSREKLPEVASVVVY